MQKVVTDELDALLEALPPNIVEPLQQLGRRDKLLEVVMDLGRLPEARYTDQEVALSQREVTQEDLDYVVSHIGVFSDDNRAGIERTLHRISAIRNRAGKIVGLTCRVGRAVYGTIRIIEDLIRTGKSLLLLGRPGVGKTTMLREVARVLADEMKKRVIIVDTSNEIAGDGDIPHPAIGHARRMQVPTPRMQHAVMIEAVENHMPEVIVIDEIGTELEAVAARTIAERGVQLVGTAHGNTLENLMMNPTLCDLIGGIQTVTLGDEEARRRGTQKSVLERKAPPTFSVLVEIQSWEKVALHSDVAAVVDAILRGQASPAEVRSLDDKGEVKVDERASHVLAAPPSWEAASRKAPPPDGKVRRLYPFGISRSRLLDVVRDMQLPAEVVDSLREADVLITSKNYYRKRPPSLRAAESSGVPVYVLRSNTQTQLEQCLSELYGIESSPHAVTRALQETEEAIREVMTHEGAVELAPQNAYVRRLQHRLAERYHVTSQSTGREPYRRVRIFKG